jgi:drug/metabolite transporter (DMT)-like permease
MSAVSAYLLLAVMLAATAVAQIAFKYHHLSGRRSALATAIVLFVAIAPMSFLSVRALGIGRVYVLTSLSYGLVAILGYRLFGERISRRQVQGLALITAGCFLYSL